MSLKFLEKFANMFNSIRLPDILTSPPWVALVRSKLKSNSKKNPRIYKCGNPGCEICNLLEFSLEFQSTSTEIRALERNI